ncbi:MAG TPA: three-Cys-motif partner protein TcmP [Coleofasciculaceae cyanobacterium]|jgi:three-Cys-motif partner protein
MAPKVFGGDWTTSKLRCLDKYLNAYTKALSKQSFETMYIDAFAGTGWLTLKQTEAEEEKSKEPVSQISIMSLFANQAEASAENSDIPLDGSARIALKVSPGFDKYIFVEQDLKRFNELQNLKAEFSEKDIEFSNSDANLFIKQLCQGSNWIREGKRAVLFLDPFGLNVSWETIEIIAKTKAIDIWYLFPLGVGLNRLLKVDGKIEESHRLIIDNVLGTTGWYEIFYKTNVYPGLFGDRTVTEKTADFNTICQYFLQRLESVFPAVADNPRMLYNSKRVPIFLLCFASSNPNGANLAKKIAQDILRTEEQSEYKLKY